MAVEDRSNSPFTPLNEQEHKELMWDTPVPSSKDPVLHEGSKEEKRAWVDDMLDTTQDQLDKQFNDAKSAWGDNLLNKEPSAAGRFRMWKDVPAIQEYLKDLPKGTIAHDMGDGTVILRRISPGETSNTPMMFQEEPHPDVESLTDSEHGAAVVTDIVTKQAVNEGIPNIDYNSMPLSTNVEDRRGQGPGYNRKTGEAGQLFSSNNEDILQLTDYLQNIKNTKGQPLPGFVHPAEKDNTLERLLTQTAAGKIVEWGVYASLANVAPRVLPAMNALWMGAWIASGHALKADIERQVKEGKQPHEITFEKGSIGDMGGIISQLQNKYKKDKK